MAGRLSGAGGGSNERRPRIEGIGGYSINNSPASIGEFLVSLLSSSLPTTNSSTINSGTSSQVETIVAIKIGGGLVLVYLVAKVL